MVSTINKIGYMNVKKVLQDLLYIKEERQMSYGELAVETGLDKSTIYRTLKGMITPSLTTVCLIAQVLEHSIILTESRGARGARTTAAERSEAQ